jgi:hypothetical protein
VKIDADEEVHEEQCQDQDVDVLFREDIQDRDHTEIDQIQQHTNDGQRYRITSISPGTYELHNDRHPCKWFKDGQNDYQQLQSIHFGSSFFLEEGISGFVRGDGGGSSARG